MNRSTLEMLNRVQSLGITLSDALALRRISMTLHRWHELECGTDEGHIERDSADHPFFYSDSGNRRPVAMADREKGALKRLAAIMAKYPQLRSYVQTDPRGCALYILRPGDVPAGEQDDAYYSRGVAVYK